MVAALTDGDLMEKLQYVEVVSEEVTYQTVTLPRTSDGAISMRPVGETVQLWSDFMSQVPPSLAFYGAVMGKPAVLLEAYNQCKLYRTHLRDTSSGLWHHILLGDFQDTGLWGTGNAWAASGMARVLATMQNGPNPANWTSQIADLALWTNEIVTSAFAHFDDASSSALLAATAFRMALLGHPDSAGTNLVVAEKIRQAVNSKIDASGWLTSVADPLVWAQSTTRSPEAQAFVIMLQAAWRDYWASQ
ncbi:hypothetical protein RQP46_009539 [Phenoliferia psychrophenolica]